MQHSMTSARLSKHVSCFINDSFVIVKGHLQISKAGKTLRHVCFNFVESARTLLTNVAPERANVAAKCANVTHERCTKARERYSCALGIMLF